MDTHLSRGRDRRAKGRTIWPEVYLGVEIVTMLATEYVIYLLGYKILTVFMALVLIFVFLRSSIPRYQRVVARQKPPKVINNAHKVKK